MVISDADIRYEERLVRGIGSTGQGVGAATARRILHRHKTVRLAKDVPELKPFLGVASDVLEASFARGERVFLEGTQGTGLSLLQSPEGGTSGNMSQEIFLTEIARRSGLNYSQLAQAERTSTTGRSRRFSEFDWALLRKAAGLNCPTDIALTFVDYLNSGNRDARRFEQLDENTIKFIQEVERVAAAPVSLISTRFHWRGIIDRRPW